MREYGQIQCSFWQRACEEQWTNDAMVLGAYLLTGPHSNGIGCYRLPNGYVCDDLGWDSERVSKGFAELFGKGFCNRFGTVVLIPKFLRWNPISNGNVAKARAQEFEAIPNEEAKQAAALALLTFGNHWGNPFRNRLETLSKGYAKQNPTQPNPTQPDKSPIGDSSPAAPADDQPPDDHAVAEIQNCPHGEIIAAYHEALPMLRRVREWTDDRKTMLRARWREKPERQDVAWWREFFAYVGTCPLLIGDHSSKDHPGWQADLEWLIRPKNFVKVIEGNYQAREAA